MNLTGAFTRCMSACRGGFQASVAAAGLAALSSAADAARIVWHSTVDSPAGQEFVDLLEAGGHEVTVLNAPGLDAARITMVNEHDLLIVSRKNLSASFEGSANQYWDTEITIPAIVMSAYLVRDSALQWVQGNDVSVDTPGEVNVDTGHPVWVCVDARRWHTAVGRGTSFNADPLVDPGVLITSATVPVGGVYRLGVIVAEWRAGTVAAGPRMLFNAGASEAEGADIATAGAYNLTPDSERAFLNATAYMAYLSGKVSKPAGSTIYQQDFTADDGATDMGDGSQIVANAASAPFTNVQGGALRLTDAFQVSSLGAFRTPPLPDLSGGFVASFDFALSGGGDRPADGFSFNFGALPEGPGGGEGGFPGATDTLTVSFDTWDNDLPDEEGLPGVGFDVYVDTIHLAACRLQAGETRWNNNAAYRFNGEPRPAWIVWQDGLLDLWVDGVPVFTGVYTGAWAPNGVVGFTARTGGSTETLQIDNVEIASNADTLIVTTLDDHDDGAATPDDTTLREAIHAAVAQPGTEVIGFLAGLTGVIHLTGALPDLSADLFLEGPGAGLLTVRRNTGGNYRVFTINNGAAITISGLTVADGNVAAGAFPADSGGGILNDRSRLTLRRCRIAENHASTGFSYGGGVFNHEGTLIVESCLFAYNHAYYGGGLANNRTGTGGLATADVTGTTFSGNFSVGGYGGAIFNSAVGAASARLTLTNSTLSGNRAYAGHGGGIYTSAADGGVGTLVLTHATLSGNSAPSGGGIYNFNFNGTANVTVRNTILHAGDSGVNLVNSGGAISSQGYNLSSDEAGGDGTTAPGGLLSVAGDVRNTDPLLAILADNGGATPTHRLLRDSPARDWGNSFGFGLDQRGLARIANAAHLPDAPGGDGTDIGALELSPFGSPTDADGDGMSDEWEDFHVVDDPDDDADADGAANLIEHHAGTDPRDPDSLPVFHVDDVTLTLIDIIRHDSGGTFSAILRVSGPPGARVQIEFSESISPPWAGFAGSEIILPASGVFDVEHAGISWSRTFYRHCVVPGS